MRWLSCPSIPPQQHVVDCTDVQASVFAEASISVSATASSTAAPLLLLLLVQNPELALNLELALQCGELQRGDLLELRGLPGERSSSSICAMPPACSGEPCSSEEETSVRCILGHRATCTFGRHIQIWDILDP